MTPTARAGALFEVGIRLREAAAGRLLFKNVPRFLDVPQVVDEEQTGAEQRKLERPSKLLKAVDKEKRCGESR